MTTKKQDDDATQTPEPYLYTGEDKKDLQQGMAQDFDKLAAEDEKKNGKKKDKSGKTYTEDPTDPAYVEPRLRPDWDPSQPG